MRVESGPSFMGHAREFLEIACAKPKATWRFAPVIKRKKHMGENHHVYICVGVARDLSRFIAKYLGIYGFIVLGNLYTVGY